MGSSVWSPESGSTLRPQAWAQGSPCPWSLSLDEWVDQQPPTHPPPATCPLWGSIAGVLCSAESHQSESLPWEQETGRHGVCGVQCCS